MNTNTPKEIGLIRAGWGLDVGQDFTRAKVDLPVEIARNEHARPGCLIGYIAADPASPLGFLRQGNRDGKVRVHFAGQALAQKEAAQ